MIYYFKKLQLVRTMYENCSLDLELIINTYFYPKLYKKILGIEKQWNIEEENELKKILQGTTHHRDFRKIREYAFSLLLNWMVEDLIFQLLEKSQVSVNKIGSDKDRKLLTGREVTADPDLLIETNKKIWIEVISNYPTNKGFSSFWEQEGFFDLRDNKYANLLDKSKKDLVFLVGVVVSKSSFFIIKIDKDLNITHKLEEKNFGYKKTTKIEFKNMSPNLISLTNFSNLINHEIAKKRV